MTMRAAAPAYTPNLTEVVSGWVYRSSETQLMEIDDFDNPGFIFVDKGIDLFNKVEGRLANHVRPVTATSPILPGCARSYRAWSMASCGPWRTSSIPSG